jgi:hypothetical protein
MSTLQLALLGLGIAVIVAVIVYNTVQERRAIKEIKLARATFGFEGEDLLVTPSVMRSGPRSEPGARNGERREPVFGGENKTDPKLWPDSIAAIPLRQSPPELAFDDETELIVSLSFDKAVEGEKLALLSSGLAVFGSKPVQVGATEIKTHRLEAPKAGNWYSGLHCSILLANRQGPLNAVEFSEFVAAVQRIAGELDVEIDVPDMPESLQRAKALDVRCAGVDAQIGLNILSNDGNWAGSLITQAAVEAGLAQRADGKFSFYRRNGNELFTLTALDAQGKWLPIGPSASSLATSALTLVLDVPRASEVEKPFTTMVNVARSLAARLGGAVVDDNRRAVSDAALGSIEVQLGPMYARLRDAGFDAGAPRTLRLFN